MKGKKPFDYPTEPHKRRHGPRGYRDYADYRPWLRDDFTFRCVYCLTRERWVQKGGMHLDHFVSRKLDESAATDYGNLVYACQRCNSTKRANLVPNPEAVAFGECLEVLEDGSITYLNEEGEWLIGLLGLDSDDQKEWRRQRILEMRYLNKKRATDKEAQELFSYLFGYPSNLPDLASLPEPPEGNSRKEGIQESAHARKRRDELPDYY
ncbi:MAG: HNH endonuclease signature motif containing protein [Chthoniobacteraceae bacterium]